MKKRILLLLLAVFLAFQPTTAFSIFSRQSRALSKKTTITLGVFGVATVVLSYVLYKTLWSPKRTNQNNKKIYVPSSKAPSRDNKSKKVSNINFSQLNVLQQKEPATCALHALKNGYTMLEQYRINKNVADTQSYFNGLQERWSPFVINARKKIALREYILNKLKNYSQHTKNVSLPFDPKTYFNNVLNNCARGIAEQAIEHLVYKDHNTFILKTTELQTTILQTTNTIKKKKHNIKDILTVFDIKSDLTINKKVINQALKQKYPNQLDQKGQWLEGNELQEIIQKGFDDKLASYFTVLDDVNQIILAENIEQYTKSWQNDQNFFHIFLVNTASEQNRTSRGHWFTIAIQKKNNKKYVIVADSLNSKRNINDHSVKRILKELNKK